MFNLLNSDTVGTNVPEGRTVSCFRLEQKKQHRTSLLKVVPTY